MSIPGRGESVGEAYVRLRVNGSGLPDDIKKEFDKLEPAMKKEGVRQSEAYREGFAEDLDRHSVKDIENSLDRQRGQRDHIADELGGRFGERMRTALSKQFQGAGGKEIADRIFSDLDAEARKHNSLAGFNPGNLDLAARTDKAIRDIQLDEARLAEIRADSARAAKAGLRDVDDGLRDVSKSTKKAEGDLTALDRAMKFIKNEDFGKFFGQGSRNNFINSFGNIIGQVARVTAFAAVGLAQDAVKIGSAFKKTEGSADSFAKRMGDALKGLGGKGLNALGAISAAVLALPAVFGIAVAAIQFFVGPLIALIVDLSAVIVALASTIGIGLIGAVGALLPLIVPLILSVGVLTLGFTKLSKAAKAAVAADFKPVTTELKNLQLVAQQGLFGKGNVNVKDEAAALIPVMKLLNPLVKGVATALAGVAINFTKALSNPDSKKFLDTFTVFAPQAITKLGKAFTSFFTGVGGLLRALVPEANKFLTALDKGAANFSKFTNSVAGQNKLAKFFSGAYDSAKLLYNFVKDLGTVLLTILDAGKNTGDALFGSINKSLLQYNTYLKSAAGQQALSRFFGQIKPFLSALGNLVGGLGKLFSSLNNSQSQNSLNAILTALGGLFALIARNVPTVIPILKDFATGISVVFKALLAIAGFISVHEDIFRPIIISLGALYVAARLSGVGGIGTLIGVVGLNIRNLVGVVNGGATQVLTSAQRLQTAVAGIGIALGGIAAGNSVGGNAGTAISAGSGALGGALLGTAIDPGFGTAIGAVLGGVAGAVESFWNRANAAASAAKSKQSAALQVIAAQAALTKQAIDSLSDSITQDNLLLGANARLTVNNDLLKSGALADAQKLNIDAKLVTDAALGNAQSKLKLIQGINKILETNPTLGLTVGADLLHKLGISTSEVAAAIRQADLAAQGLGTLDKNLGLRPLTEEILGYGKALEDGSIGAVQNLRFLSDHLTALSTQFQKQGPGKVAAEQAQFLATAAKAFGVSVADLKALIAGIPTTIKPTLDINDKATPTLAGVKNSLANIGIGVKIPVSDPNSTAVKSSLQGVLGLFNPLKLGVSIPIATPGLSLALTGIKAVQTALAALYQNIEHPPANAPSGIGGLVGIPVPHNTPPPHKTAIGGLFKRAAYRMIGEAGPEAVVPMNRPLSQVDPSVRALSAFAQGKYDGAGMGNGAATTNQVNAMPSIVIQDGGAFIKTASTNADAILAEVTARWAVQGY